MDSTIKQSFIDRKEELNFLNEWVRQEPNSLLFVYGSKSSGKTTLLMKFIGLITKDNKFHVKNFNLRKILITSYKDFIQTFFEIDFERSKDEIKEKREYNLKVFKLTTEILKGLENKEYDPFVVLETELKKISNKDVRPIIIVDELQALENIYINGQRDLLMELFNFFVAMTKESHLCNVIIASSDGYFINRIYTDSRLAKTSAFYEVGYLSEDSTKYWLYNLAKESGIKDYTLSHDQINTIYKYFGGSMWEISHILGLLIPLAVNKKINDEDLKNIIDKQIDVNNGRFYRYAKLNNAKRTLFKKIYEVSQSKDEFNEENLKSLVEQSFLNEEDLTNELNELVRLNYLAYDPTSDYFKLQGNSMYYGLERYLKRISS